MDEIVFEFRNKNYGAYVLRKLYNKHVTVSLLLAVFMLCAGLCYPFISGFYRNNHGRFIKEGVIIDVINLPPADKAPPPPPPPPSIDIKRLVLRPPIVTEGEIPDDEGLVMDDYNRNAVNTPINTEEPITRAEEPAILDVEPEPEPPTYVQEMPTFVGGEPAMYQFIAANINYPKLANETNVQGKVFVSFVIDASGHVTRVKLLRGIGSGCDEEAMRVISMMPAWNAGRQNGRAVSVLFNMPIVFRLKN
jgi:periplasmic protein TonB